MELRLGQILVENGNLTKQQVEQALERQRCEGRPFGALCEEMFGLCPDLIEEAWARQYALITRSIEPKEESFQPEAQELITRRQAWQFRILPIRFDGRELMVATTPRYLRRALRFASHSFKVPVYFVMTTPQALGEALCRHYSLPGLTADSVEDCGMDQLFASLNSGDAR